jgi:hypothetical protein
MAQRYVAAISAAIDTGFAQGNGFEYFAGPGLDDPEVRREVARRWRNSAIEDHIAPAESCRWVAEQIPDGRYEELSGYHYCVFDPDINARYVSLIEEFLTGATSVAPASQALATVMSPDVVASTQTASELGDRAWRDLLEEHDRRAAELIGRYQGLVVKSTGDGILATVDGPGRAVLCAQALLEAGRQ